MNQHIDLLEVESVLRAYGDMVLRLAMTRCGNRTDAEDIFQEVFLRYLRSKEKIQDAEHCKAWLIRTTINCSKSLFTSAWHQRTVPLAEEIPFSSPEEYGIYETVLSLPQKYRTALYLFYYEQYSIAEIAALTGGNPSTIKSHLRRGRALLEAKLREEDPDEYPALSQR